MNIFTERLNKKKADKINAFSKRKLTNQSIQKLERIPNKNKESEQKKKIKTFISFVFNSNMLSKTVFLNIYINISYLENLKHYILGEDTDWKKETRDSRGEVRQDRRFNRISGTKAPLNSEKIERERERERGFRERKREVLERERICRFDSHARTPLCLNILALFYSLYPSVYFVIINVFVLFCVFFFIYNCFFDWFSGGTACVFYSDPKHDFSSCFDV